MAAPTDAGSGVGAALAVYAKNTLAALRNSIDIGVDVIEIDLRGTADGKVAIMHDETVERTTDGTGVKLLLDTPERFLPCLLGL